MALGVKKREIAVRCCRCGSPSWKKTGT